MNFSCPDQADKKDGKCEDLLGMISSMGKASKFRD